MTKNLLWNIHGVGLWEFYFWKITKSIFGPNADKQRAFISKGHFFILFFVAMQWAFLTFPTKNNNWLGIPQNFRRFCCSQQRNLFWCPGEGDIGKWMNEWKTKMNGVDFIFIWWVFAFQIFWAIFIIGKFTTASFLFNLGAKITNE